MGMTMDTKMLRSSTSTKIIRNIVYGFLFAFCKTAPLILVLCVLLPSHISTPVKSDEYSGIVLDFHQQKMDLACLNEVLYFESLNQSEEGMKAVLTVILNRKQARGFPSSICGVVQQASQFSYRRGVKQGVVIKPQPKNSVDKAALRRIQSLSDSVVQGTFEPNLNKNVLWYTKHTVERSWMRGMTVKARVGAHKFLALKD